MDINCFDLTNVTVGYEGEEVPYALLCETANGLDETFHEMKKILKDGFIYSKFEGDIEKQMARLSRQKPEWVFIVTVHYEDSVYNPCRYYAYQGKTECCSSEIVYNAPTIFD